MNNYRAGIDIGSTTIKLTVLDEDGKILYGEYRRHCAEIQPTLCALLEEARAQVGACTLKVKITGSGSINLGKSLGIGFVQEVVAVACRMPHRRPMLPLSWAVRMPRSSTSPVGWRNG